MSGPRSNFSFLPFEVRYRIYDLLLDGATMQTVVNDTLVSEAYARIGAKLNTGAFARLKKTGDYKDYAKVRKKSAEHHAADRVATHLLRENDVSGAVGEQAKVALIKAVAELSMSDNSDNSEMSDMEKVKVIRSLGQTLGSLDSATLKNQIAELKRKLDDRDRAFAAKEAEWKALDAERLATISAQASEIKSMREKFAELGMAQAGNVADEMDKRTGL